MILSKFFGQVTHQSKHYYCGSFSTELQAAQAVNAKCVELDIPLKNPEIELPENKQEVICIYFYYLFGQKVFLIFSTSTIIMQQTVEIPMIYLICF